MSGCPEFKNQQSAIINRHSGDRPRPDDQNRRSDSAPACPWGWHGSCYRSGCNTDAKDVVFQKYETGEYYDEMFAGNGAHPVRGHYHRVKERFESYSDNDFKTKQTAIDRAFVEHGVTFTVYSDDQGTERIFPFDPFPRIIPSDEWDLIERGLIQRITALNLFLHDIYHDAQIVADEVVPEHVIASAAHYLWTMERVLRESREAP